MNIFPGPLKKEMSHAVGNQTDPLDDILENFKDWCQERNDKKDTWLPHSQAKAAINAEIAKARAEVATDFVLNPDKARKKWLKVLEAGIAKFKEDGE